MKTYLSKSGVELTLTEEQAFAYKKISEITFLKEVGETEEIPEKKRVKEVLKETENHSE